MEVGSRFFSGRDGGIRRRCCLVVVAFAALSAAACTRDAPPSSPPGPPPPADGAWHPTSDGLRERYREMEGHHHAPPAGSTGPVPGIYEVSRDPNATPTDEERQRSKELVEASYEAAERNGWYDYDTALEQGFHLMMDIDHLHYGHDEFLADDAVLDPDRPEFLMYYDTPGGKKLAGMMYLAASQFARGPTIGGPLTVWHYHQWEKPMCWENGVPVAMPGDDGACPKGDPADRSPEMLHVWLLDHPEGPFATEMQLSPELIEKLAER